MKKMSYIVTFFLHLSIIVSLLFPALWFFVALTLSKLNIESIARTALDLTIVFSLIASVPFAIYYTMKSNLRKVKFNNIELSKKPLKSLNSLASATTLFNIEPMRKFIYRIILLLRRANIKMYITKDFIEFVFFLTFIDFMVLIFMLYYNYTGKNDIVSFLFGSFLNVPFDSVKAYYIAFLVIVVISAIVHELFHIIGSLYTKRKY